MPDVIEEQIAYYRARAREYDATTTPAGDPFAAHGEATREALRAFGPRGDVLELACGTGQWTELLVEYAATLTAVDASPEMIELNRSRVGEPRIRYLVANVLDWIPPRTYDVVMFGFFLSHVPETAFESFWQLVRRCLRPSGRVFFVDEGEHEAWDEQWVNRESGIVRRRLRDGSTHRAVKVLWRPADLEARLRSIGWEGSVSSEGPFYWGIAHLS